MTTPEERDNIETIDVSPMIRSEAANLSMLLGRARETIAQMNNAIKALEILVGEKHTPRDFVRQIKLAIEEARNGREDGVDKLGHVGILEAQKELDRISVALAPILDNTYQNYIIDTNNEGR